MKKIVLLLISMAAFLSCEGPIGPEGPMGPQGSQGSGNNWKIQNFTVESPDWVYAEDQNTGLNKHYFFTFQFSELSSFIYRDGLVVAYLVDNTSQQTLPVVRHFENDKKAKWTRTIDYEINQGKITFYVTNSDFINQRPETLNFRVVMMW